MAVTLEWFLSTKRDSRTDPSLGHAVGAEGSGASEIDHVGWAGTRRLPAAGPTTLCR